MAQSRTGQENPRSTMVSVRLAPEEQEALKAEASQSGESLSQFIRQVLLQRGIPSEEYSDTRMFATSSTVVAGGLAVEARDGQLVPKTSHPYVSAIVPG